MSDQPGEFELLCTRAVALRKGGNLDAALSIAQQALRISPDSIAGLRVLASIYRALNQNDAAIETLLRAAESEPRNAQVQFALGNALEAARRYTEAAGAFAAASKIDPDWPNPRYALGAALARIGRLDDANAVFRTALARSPDDPALHSNVLFAELYSPDATDESLAREHKIWWQRHGEKFSKSIRPHQNDRKADRILRVGYLSPHFREHPISFFIEPILRSHHDDAVQCFWYSDVAAADATTNRLRAIADSRHHVWRETAKLDDHSLDDLIRADAVDILVDLTQHMSHNRMMLFSRKPAPIQVAYLGYPYSTGLETMDYRIGDLHLDPPARDLSGPERLLRLPVSYFSYAAPDTAPPISSRSSSEPITFGSMNQLMKINARTIDAWSRVMSAVDRSHLLIKAKGLEDPFARERLLREFAQRGIAGDRVEFAGFSPLIDAMREMSQRVDIVLDTLPYPGGTTSCHLLWMGLPVVTLAGELPIHRMGASVLHNIGLDGLIATDVDQFVRLAVELANDPVTRRELRSAMRDRMSRSPLMNEQRFARDLENLYREIWRAQTS